MEQLIDELIVMQDNLDITSINKMHMVHGKNSYMSDENLGSESINQYFQKEIELRAILGPLEPPDDLNIHCSPLLTRLKELNKRRIILDVSYPHGASVNELCG